MTVFEHAAQEFREGIESVQATQGTLADADPEALIALAIGAVLTLIAIIVGNWAQRR